MNSASRLDQFNAATTRRQGIIDVYQGRIGPLRKDLKTTADALNAGQLSLNKLREEAFRQARNPVQATLDAILATQKQVNDLRARQNQLTDEMMALRQKRIDDLAAIDTELAGLSANQSEPAYS